MVYPQLQTTTYLIWTISQSIFCKGNNIPPRVLLWNWITLYWNIFSYRPPRISFSNISICIFSLLSFKFQYMSNQKTACAIGKELKKKNDDIAQLPKEHIGSVAWESKILMILSKIVVFSMLPVMKLYYVPSLNCSLHQKVREILGTWGHGDSEES